MAIMISHRFTNDIPVKYLQIAVDWMFKCWLVQRINITIAPAGDTQIFHLGV